MAMACAPFICKSSTLGSEGKNAPSIELSQANSDG
jgi:hypothetical protein